MNWQERVEKKLGKFLDGFPPDDPMARRPDGLLWFDEFSGGEAKRWYGIARTAVALVIDWKPETIPVQEQGKSDALRNYAFDELGYGSNEAYLPSRNRIERAVNAEKALAKEEGREPSFLMRLHTGAIVDAKTVLRVMDLLCVDKHCGLTCLQAEKSATYPLVVPVCETWKLPRECNARAIFMPFRNLNAPPLMEEIKPGEFRWKPSLHIGSGAV